MIIYIILIVFYDEDGKKGIKNVAKDMNMLITGIVLAFMSTGAAIKF